MLLQWDCQLTVPNFRLLGFMNNYDSTCGLSFEGGYTQKQSRSSFVMAGRTRFRIQSNLRLTRGFFYRQDMVSKRSIFFQGTLLLHVPVDGSILSVHPRIREILMFSDIVVALLNRSKIHPNLSKKLFWVGGGSPHPILGLNATMSTYRLQYYREKIDSISENLDLSKIESS